MLEIYRTTKEITSEIWAGWSGRDQIHWLVQMQPATGGSFDFGERRVGMFFSDFFGKISRNWDLKKLKFTVTSFHISPFAKKYWKGKNHQNWLLPELAQPLSWESLGPEMSSPEGPGFQGLRKCDEKSWAPLRLNATSIYSTTWFLQGISRLNQDFYLFGIVINCG